MRISSPTFPDLGPAAGNGAGLVDPPEGIERDVIFETPLEAGEQTLRLLIRGLNAQIDWLELERLP